MLPGRSALVLRGGPGMVVDLVDGRRFAVTLDDPAEPVAILNALARLAALSPLRPRSAPPLVRYGRDRGELPLRARLGAPSDGVGPTLLEDVVIETATAGGSPASAGQRRAT